MIRTSRVTHARQGFTLLEIVISIAVMLGAITAIFQLISIGSQAAVQARFRTDAVLYAETKLQEAVGGIIPMQSGGGTVEEDELWEWSLTVEPGTIDGLLTVSVTLLRRDERNPNANHSYTLQRIVRDPQLFLDAALGE